MSGKELSKIDDDKDKVEENNLPADDLTVDKETSDNTGMDMGTKFKEDKEQDLDDLIHDQENIKRNDIPPPEES